MNKPKDKTIHVTETTHKIVKEHLNDRGRGEDIGKFFDEAALEKIEKEKSTIKK